MYTRPTVLDDLCPTDLGLPSKFTEFRQIQREITDFALYGPDPDSTPRRFIGCGAPGGSGKSLASQVRGRLAGVKYAVLTATRALEDQISGDGFPGLVNIRGRANYECADTLDPLHPDRRSTCEEGYDGDCNFCDTSRCTYTAQTDRAKMSRAILSNYSYWPHARSNNRLALERRGGADPIRLLIVDECHRAFSSLASFLGVWFSNDDLHRFARDTYRETLSYTRGRDWGRVELPWLNLLTAVWIGVAVRMEEIAGHFKTEAEAARKSK
jgi:Rad3-related DNA helicase